MNIKDVTIKYFYFTFKQTNIKLKMFHYFIRSERNNYILLTFIHRNSTNKKFCCITNLCYMRVYCNINPWTLYMDISYIQAIYIMIRL